MKFFKLGKRSLSGMVSEPDTVRYPEVSYEPHINSKGSMEIDMEECVLCGMCARGCPTYAIVVDKGNKIWKINHFMCIQCEACMRACPKQCLYVRPHWQSPSTNRHDWHVFTA